MNVRIYVEGGGEQQLTLTNCRAGFSRFVAKVVKKGRMPRIIASGSRNAAFDDFCTAIKLHPKETIVLLVDSEDEVSETECWKHLKSRDGWDAPASATEQNVYLMVRCMESWFLADKAALQAFYGKKLAINKLPGSTDVENISKKDVCQRLDHITALVERKYHKTQHGFEIFASLDPNKVASGSAQAKRFVEFLQKL